MQSFAILTLTKMFQIKISFILFSFLLNAALAHEQNYSLQNFDLKLLKLKTEFKRNFFELLDKINMERSFNYILLVKTPTNECIFDDLVKYFKVPWLILPNIVEATFLPNNSNEMITLSCEGPLQFPIVKNEFQYVRHLILLEPSKADIEICTEFGIKSGETQHIMFTVPSILNHSLYNCALLSYAFLEKNYLKLEPHESVFPNDYVNMQGRFVVTQSNLLPPYNILYEDKFGKRYLEGYVGNCVKTYAERHKANLEIMTTGNVLHYKELYGFVVQGLTDIPTIETPLEHEGLSTKFSYPLEFIDECFMIPVPRAKPVNTLFFSITQWSVLVIILLLSFIYATFLSVGKHRSYRYLSLMEVIFSDKSIRGLLGQSFVMPTKISIFMKYIYLLIFYTNLMVMTFYTAYLQSNLVALPLEKKIRNLDDIREAGLKIAVHPRDLEDWSYDFYKNHQDILYVTNNNYSEFLQLRDNFNLSYVYPVAYPSWTIYHEQQKLFKHKIFFYSTEFCTTKMMPFSIPFRPYLPFRDLFNQHLLDVRDTGLLQHWFEEVFISLIRLKMLSFDDLSKPDAYDGLINWYDLYWIWIIYCVCMCVGIVVFILECMTNVIYNWWCKF